jgi:hypothetical protein
LVGGIEVSRHDQHEEPSGQQSPDDRASPGQYSPLLCHVSHHQLRPVHRITEK